jgi:hypothetical protein
LAHQNEQVGKTFKALTFYQKALEIAAVVPGADLIFCQSKISTLEGELRAMHPVADVQKEQKKAEEIRSVIYDEYDWNAALNDLNDAFPEQEENDEKNDEFHFDDIGDFDAPPPEEVEEARSAFQIFFEYNSERIHSKHPEIQTPEMFQIVAKRFWKQLQNDKRMRYKEAATLDGVRFQRKIPLNEQNRFPW